MSLILEKLKRLNDKAFDSGQVNREQGAHDMVFHWVSGAQWDNFVESCPLHYRGEFHIIDKAVRDVISGLESNPIQIDFSPKSETRDDAAETADRLYRADDGHNTSLWAYENAKQDCVVCGTGAWELRTEYETNRAGDEKQVVRRYPILEANNNVLWDPNAKMIDKSDADYVSVLKAYTPDGYRELVKEFKGEDVDDIDAHYKNAAQSFAHPEQSYQFPWLGGESEKIYITDFYHREKVKTKILTMQDPMGQEMILSESHLEDVMDDMMDAGYKIIDEKDIERWQVTKYIASGAEILDESVIAGENIPIIPMYGEIAPSIEGEQVTRGLIRLAKDPQMLYNFMMSYIADVASMGPREKDVWIPEQIQGHEKYYNITGPENDFPYALQNAKDADGEALPIGPVGKITSPQIPPAVAQLIPLAEKSVNDVADPGLPQDIADPDVSGKAILALQARLDKQSMIYQTHYKHAKRRDAEVWVSMASEIYDVPRKVQGELPDGTKKEIEVMQAVIDEETGDIVFLNDLRNAEFDVRSNIGQAYTTQKEQTFDKIGEVIAQMPPDAPMRGPMQLKQIMLLDGIDLEGIRKAARKQMILDGVEEPETDEEKAMLEQAAQTQQQPDAAMVLAKAEELKGKADIMEQEQKGIEMQLNDANMKTKLSIEQQKLINERIKLQIEAQKVGATINKTGAETTGVQLDNQLKIKEIELPDFAAMGDMELEDIAFGRAA